MQRRMFSPQIVGSDAFLDMPTSSRELYFQLGMYADDDGFINPKKIMRMTGASEDDLKVLLSKRFVLVFEEGVIVIKHWRINNLIRKDWHRETAYTDQLKRLKIKENGAYTEFGNESVTSRQRSVVKCSVVKCSNSTPEIGVEKVSQETKEEKPQFSLKEEIKKMEENPRRDINIIALYFEERKPDIRTYGQLQIAIKRHLRAAKMLIPFSDEQILTGVEKAKNRFAEEWTLETAMKYLTK